MVFSKKSFFLFVLFSLTFSFLFGQNALNSAGGSASTSETEITLSIPDSNAETSLAFSETGSKSSVWPFIKMILVLLLVVAAIYGLLYFLKRRGNGVKSEDEFLRRVAYLNLGQGKSVEVVTLVDRGAYLLGVTEGGINLIAEVKDEELIQAMNLYADKKSNSSKPKNFADVLDLFMPGGPRENNASERKSGRNSTNVFSAGEQDMDQLFQASANRLNENE